MTIFRTFNDAEREGLKLHGLDTKRPSQLSDAFVLGMRYAAEVLGRTPPADGEMASEPALPDADVQDESGLLTYYSKDALAEYAQAWRDDHGQRGRP